MKQRILVMNGQRLLQIERNGEWQVSKVDKAGLIPPGIYNLNSAVAADRNKPYQGVVLHVSSDLVFQKSAREIFKHQLQCFDKAPVVGESISVQYCDEKIEVRKVNVIAVGGLKR